MQSTRLQFPVLEYEGKKIVNLSTKRVRCFSVLGASYSRVGELHPCDDRLQPYITKNELSSFDRFRMEHITRTEATARFPRRVVGEVLMVPDISMIIVEEIILEVVAKSGRDVTCIWPSKLVSSFPSFGSISGGVEYYYVVLGKQDNSIKADSYRVEIT